MTVINHTRRHFLSRSLCSAASLTAASSLGVNLALANAALASHSGKFDDYKALVCVFLFGGNDSFNMLVPTDDAEYQIYQQVRQSLAYDKTSLLGVNPASTQTYALGMPPQMQGAHSLFTQKKLAFVANAGPLLQPTTKLSAMQDRTTLPSQLFSHNSQQNLWQSAHSQVPAFTGWAGRMAELIGDTQAQLPINMSINGLNLWQTGTSGVPFSLNASGPEQFSGLDPSKAWDQQRIAIFDRLMNGTEHVLEQGFKNVLVSAKTNNTIAAQALEQAAETQVSYPDDNSLASQLKMVAQLADVQNSLGQNRQIFFVGLGGWDTHDDQATRHPLLLQTLSDALLAFQSNLEELGLEQKVTTFTMSDFGRTLTSNGDGTDHGWGGHQMIMGGAVKGGDIYGRMPALELDSDDDFGDGRIIPTVSVEEYAASLVSWFGLSNTELNAIFPHLSRFNREGLDFFMPS